MSEPVVAPLGPSVRFYPPSPPLKPFLTSIYVVEASGPFLDYLHPEWGNIRLVLSGNWATTTGDGTPDPVRQAMLFGPTDRTRIVTTQAGLLIGIGLTPLGWLRLVETDAARYANQVADLGSILGPDAQSLLADLRNVDEPQRIETLLALLEAQMARTRPGEALVEAVHQQLIACDHNSALLLAAAVDTSERTLQRICRRAFGFASKRLLRRQRFLRALSGSGIGSGTDAGLGLGDEYYDQSHFIREFRQFMGMTPSAYARLPRVALSRAAAERKRILGQSLQGLHPVAP